MSSRTWAELPDAPGPSTSSPSLSLIDQRLYTFSAGQTSYLNIDKGSYDDFSGRGELGLTPIGPWQSLPPTPSAPEKDHPGERTAASMIPITTGPGTVRIDPLPDVYIGIFLMGRFVSAL